MSAITSIKSSETVLREEPVAATQVFREGDPVVLNGSGLATVGAIGATTIDGFAAHSKASIASPALTDTLLFYSAEPELEYRATLKTATAQAQSLVGVAAGLIDEGGEMRVDTAATVKQFVITDIVRGGSGKDVKIRLLAANRRIT